LNDAEPNAARDMVYVLFKRCRRIALVTAATASACYLLTSAQGARYSATSRVLVTASAPAPQIAASSVVFQEHGLAAQNEAEMLRDPALIRAMIPALKARLTPQSNLVARGARHLGAWWHEQAARLGLAVPETQDQRLAQLFTHALDVSVVKDTDVVALRFTWTDPAFASFALNTLLEKQQSLSTGQVEATQAITLAQAQLHDKQTQLTWLNAQILGSSGNDAGTIEREKERLTSRIAAAQTTANALHLERDLVAHQLETADATYTGGGWVDDPDAPAAIDPAFVDLLDKRQKLLAHLAPDNPHVHSVDVQIAQAREHAHDKARHVFGARLKSLDDRLSAIDTQSAADRALVSGLDERLIEAEALLRSRDAASSLVSEATRHAEDVRRQTQPALRDIGFRVLSQAVPPAEPDWPSPLLVLCLATLLGFGAGLASAMRAERSLLTIDRARDITRLLRIPVLASVPELR
jgi:uncharacterized protein involved in exopolysaccharide biosynthesis